MHAKDAMNLWILCMFEGTFFLEVAQIININLNVTAVITLYGAVKMICFNG